VATALSKGHVAGLAAIRTIIEAVGAQVYVALALANGAVFVAMAVLLCLVALHADGGTRHETPPRRMYLGNAAAARKYAAVCG